MATTARLRQETRAAHEAIESRLDFFSRPLTIDRYANLLERWLGFTRTWERSAAIYFANDRAFFDRRRRVPLLRRDLFATGRSATSLARSPRLPAATLHLRSRADALGFLYVVEGSTHGGQVIVPRITEQLGFTATHGCTYYAGFGRETRARWMETAARIDAAPIESADAIIAAANRAFGVIADWLTS